MSHRGDHSMRNTGWTLIAANLVVLALAGGGAGWWLEQHHHHLPTSIRQVMGQCAAGPATMQVTADPDIAAAISHIADHYNAARPVVDNHCATVAVTAQPSPAIATALPGPNWDEAALGPRPALWVPQSSRWVQQARTVVRDDPKPVATSPIVLAVAEQLRKALSDNRIGWSDLPALQQSSLASVGLAPWGRLGMALPNTDATLGAVEAVAEVTSGAVPLSDDAARSPAVTAAAAGLVADAPKFAPGNPLTTLGGQVDPVAAELHAVPATLRQTQLAKLAAYQPTGTTPVADYPATQLSGPWIDPTQQAIADEFAYYLLSPDQLSTFADAGFQPPRPLPGPPSKVALDQLTQVLTHPTLGLNTTILLDNTAAMATQDGANSRVANVVTTLRTTLDSRDAGSGAGLWLVDSGIPEQLYKVVDATVPLAMSHRAALTADLSTVRPTTSTSDNADAALEAAYQSALTGYAPNKANTVLFITSGPHNTSNVTDAQLLASVTAAADKTKPVRVDVVVISDTDSPTMKSLAHDTGGTYARLTTTDTPALANALATVLAP